MKTQSEHCLDAHRDLEESIDRITRATSLLDLTEDEEGDLDTLLTALAARSYDLECWLESNIKEIL